jgi:hypothetical protein
LLNLPALKDLLHQPALSKLDSLLLCLAAEPVEPKSVSDIKAVAAAAGLRKAACWNVSDHLSKSRGCAIRTPDGWELTANGQARVQSLAGPYVSGPAVAAAASLRSHLSKITNPDTQAFVEEAIRCFEAKLLRAAIVLSWVGAIALIQDHIVSTKLAAFNAEARKRDAKWKDASSRDDLARLKEHDFLQICHAISVIGKSVKDELEGCLKLRNGCGHPNSLKVGEHRASSHVETLIQNVFVVF